MDREIEVFVLQLLRQHNILTLATAREDGWPQATTVGYVNDGLTLYVGCEADSQKVRNIKRSNKVSLTVDLDEEDWSRIQGLSMGATAEIVTNPAEVTHIGELMFAKYPQLQAMAPPDPKDFAFLKITPKVISVLDYTKGFGHGACHALNSSSSWGDPTRRPKQEPLKRPFDIRDVPPAPPTPPPGFPAPVPAAPAGHPTPGATPTRGHCAAAPQRATRSSRPGSSRPAPPSPQQTNAGNGLTAPASTRD